MDDIDRKILSAMQASPDSSVADIADKVGLSNTPCWRRIKRMESEGIILGRALLLSQKALGLTLNIFANIKLKQHDEETLEALDATFQKLDEIVECFTMGGESDYLLRIVAKDIEDYERFLKKVLLHLPGVASVNSSFSLGTIKITTSLPVSA